MYKFFLHLLFLFYIAYGQLSSELLAFIDNKLLTCPELKIENKLFVNKVIDHAYDPIKITRTFEMDDYSCGVTEGFLILYEEKAEDIISNIIEIYKQMEILQWKDWAIDINKKSITDSIGDRFKYTMALYVIDTRTQENKIIEYGTPFLRAMEPFKHFFLDGKDNYFLYKTGKVIEKYPDSEKIILGHWPEHLQEKLKIFLYHLISEIDIEITFGLCDKKWVPILKQDLFALELEVLFKNYTTQIYLKEEFKYDYK